MAQRLPKTYRAEVNMLRVVNTCCEDCTKRSLSEHIGWLAKNIDEYGDEAERQVWSIVLAVHGEYVAVAPLREDPETGEFHFGDPAKVKIKDVNAYPTIAFIDADEVVEDMDVDSESEVGFADGYAAALIASAIKWSFSDEYREDLIEEMDNWLNLSMKGGKAFQKALFLSMLATKLEKRCDEVKEDNGIFTFTLT